MIPIDPAFWEHLFTGVTPGGKIVLVVLLVIAVLGGKALSVIATYVKETRHEAKEARKEAALAAERSKPTSNGFVGDITRALQRIEDTQAVLLEQQAHTSSDLRKLTNRVKNLEQPQP